MPNETTHLFALLDDKKIPVRRISLEREFSKKLEAFFSEQQQAFIHKKQYIEFKGGYNVEEDEIFQIEDYSLPESISYALSNPLKVLTLNLETEIPRITSLFMGRWDEQDKIVKFQAFDTGKLISNKGWTIIYSKDTYKKLEEPGLVLQNKLTAYFSNGTLLFVNYHNTNKFLNLSDHYATATDDDLKTFAKNRLFKLKDKDIFINNADFMMRKKIAWLLRSKMLDTLSVDKIKVAADDLNQDGSDEHKIPINIDNDRIIIPEDKKQLKEFIRFLCEDHFKAPLSKKRCRTNSKIYIYK